MTTKAGETNGTSGFSPLDMVKRVDRAARRLMSPEIRDGFRKIWSGRYGLLRGPLTYNHDGLATRHNADFIHEPRFAAAYRAGKGTGSWYGSDLEWRAHTLCWAADRGSRLEGDFVECGVDRGGYSMTVAEYVGFKNLPKRFYLLDTFSGIVTKYLSDEERAHGLKEGMHTECYEHVKQAFSGFSNVEIIRGPVPDTLGAVKATKVAYLSIDMNSREPEIAAAEFFWPRLVSGAAMILDDFGFTPRHIVQKKAFDEFAAGKGVPLLTLPTGQGLIIKP